MSTRRVAKEKVGAKAKAKAGSRAKSAAAYGPARSGRGGSPRFSAETLAFIEKASRQKRPDWLERNRADYEQAVLEPIHHLARQLKSKLAGSANGYHFPQRGLGRMKRSARRAEEYGAPFRDYVSYSASRPSASRFDHNPNLYLLIHPGDEDGEPVLLAGGFYMPSSRQLRAIRETIAQDASAFDELFADPAFAGEFPGGFSDEKKSSRAPRGFDPNHPRLDWLKLQAYFVWRPIPRRDFYAADFPERLAAAFAQIVRLNDLLERSVAGRLATRTEPRAVGLTRDNSGLASRLEDVEAPRRKMDF